MLASFRSLNEPFNEVNVSTPTPMYKLVSGGLLRTLMQRTGTGSKVTVRELAALTGIAIGTIGALATGAQQLLPEDKAKSMARAIGVDLLILFIPCERAGRVYVEAERDGHIYADEQAPAVAV
jgi:hypothetical protein